ncbi:MAG: hypothetical protein MZU97_03675 [Bacillus subtilis]|nr:hypothetical protein [Bacillus subtilis]
MSCDHDPRSVGVADFFDDGAAEAVMGDFAKGADLVFKVFADQTFVSGDAFEHR